MRIINGNYISKIICGKCEDVMEDMPENFVDLTVTSPPYDKLRNYKGYKFDFKGTAKELYRVTKIGGVVVWVVGDQTINGSETGTSFKQALYFKEIGFNLHDTMIYQKLSVGACGSNLSYWQVFEYMFVFSKGKPKTVNRIKDKINSSVGHKSKPNKKMDLLKTRTNRVGVVVGEIGYRENIWIYHTGMFSGDDKTTHPAPFPEKLAADHIISWSNENDIVLDPMCGSGTTCKMAKRLNRRYIGIDTSEKYCQNARDRISNIEEPLF